MIRSVFSKRPSLWKTIGVSQKSFVTADIWGEVLDGKLSKNEEYDLNQKNMVGIVSHFKASLAQAMEAGGPKAIEKHKARGKLLARERIDNLVDPGSPFLGKYMYCISIKRRKHLKLVNEVVRLSQ